MLENTVKLRVSKTDPTKFQLLESVAYEGRSETIIVPAGMITDLASVPMFLTWLIPRYGPYTAAAVLHDYLCYEAAAGRFSRRDADGIFRRCLREAGVGVTQRWVMWSAVRAGGRWSDATAGELSLALLIGLLAIIVLFIPTVTVVVWLTMFRLINTVVRAVRRTTHN